MGRAASDAPPATSSLDSAEALSAKGATAPRVSLESLKGKVSDCYFVNAGEAVEARGTDSEGVALDDHETPDGGPLFLLTLCFLVLHNGWTVLGKSAPVSAENFDAAKGRTFAFEDALRQLWPLEGYRLRDELHQQEANTAA